MSKIKANECCETDENVILPEKPEHNWSKKIQSRLRKGCGDFGQCELKAKKISGQSQIKKLTIISTCHAPEEGPEDQREKDDHGVELEAVAQH